MSRFVHQNTRCLAIVCLVTAFLAGCIFQETLFEKSRREPVEPQTTGPLAGIITDYAELEGVHPLRVQGIGTVARLAGTGGAQCPSGIRRFLIETMRKRGLGSPTKGTARITPERFLRGKDTAVVRMTGWIPAAAAKGTRFDVEVRALSRSDTTSLDGGLLYSWPLRIYRPDSRGMEVGSADQAEAAGPLFVNPFGLTSQAASRFPARLRKARVIGGGKVVKPRRIRLVLNEPSYAIAARMKRRINSRFPARTKTADAVSPSYVELVVPPVYRDRRELFLQLIMHLPLRGSGIYMTEKLQELRDAVRKAPSSIKPKAPMNRIALVLEAVGKKSVPYIQSFYRHTSTDVNFYLARCGARLEDPLAVTALERIAHDDNHLHQEDAIEVLGELLWSRRAGLVLLPLLDDTNPRIRRAAYEALLDRRSPAIISEKVGKHFVMDLVPSKGAHLIYVTRFKQARLALFGPQMPVNPPLFYRSYDRRLTVSAPRGQDRLQVFRKMPLTGVLSESFRPPLRVADLIRTLGGGRPRNRIEKPQGVNLSFSQVCGVLYDLTKSGAIPANFLLQRPETLDLITRPQSQPQKPEPHTQ